MKRLHRERIGWPHPLMEQTIDSLSPLLYERVSQKIYFHIRDELELRTTIALEPMETVRDAWAYFEHP